MQAQRTLSPRGNTSTDAVAVYGHRLARRAILRRYCSPDHPVVQIEEDLVEMARAQLQELVLTGAADRAQAARDVREAAAAKVLASEEEDQVKVSALTEVVRMTCDELLPRSH